MKLCNINVSVVRVAVVRVAVVRVVVVRVAVVRVAVVSVAVIKDEFFQSKNLKKTLKTEFQGIREPESPKSGLVSAKESGLFPKSKRIRLGLEVMVKG